MRIGLLGCGAIGRIIAIAMDRTEDISAIYLYDRSEEQARSLAARLDKAVHVSSVDTVIAKTELVIEAASQEACKEYAPQVLWAGRDIMIMSVGAFADDKFTDHVRKLAREHRAKVYIPTGALAGVDGVRCAAEGRIDEVTLVTRKPPAGFRGSDAVARLGIDLGSLKEERVLYDGPARQAVVEFPQNVNVAAALAMAGVGFDETRVRIVADPRITTNQHTVHLRGSFGEMEAWVSNYPSPDNPKTSFLAALSAISLVRKIAGPIWVGA